MTQEDQLKHFEVITTQMKEILFKKGNDYANIDRLSNFKLAGSICGITAEQNCLSLIATKVARLGVLLNSDKVPNNESIHDSVLDLANYSILLEMILAESRAEKLPESKDQSEELCFCGAKLKFACGDNRSYIICENGHEK